MDRLVLDDVEDVLLDTLVVTDVDVVDVVGVDTLELDEVEVEVDVDVDVDVDVEVLEVTLEYVE